MKTKQRPRVADTRKPSTQRVNLQLSVDAYRRLSVHCAMEGTNPGAEVTRLIDEFLRSWSLPARRSPAGPGVPDDRLEADAHVRREESAAA